MYIWVGIDVDDQYPEIKKKALAIDKSIGFKNSCFTLPLHISLKMSFKIDKAIFDSIIEEIIQYYSSIAPFEIRVDKIEKYDNIIWIRMHRNEQLDQVHDKLNSLLMEKYNIGLHEYDLDYKYHTTLFMDNDCQGISDAYDRIKDDPLPQTILANQFIIGTSETGELGTYHVYQKIKR